VSFVRTYGTGESRYSRLFLINFDGTQEEELINEKLLDNGFQHSWSPDGEKVVFQKIKPIFAHDICVLTYSTKKIDCLTNDDFNDHDPSWSPDGEHIAFISDRGTPYFQVYLMKADGSEIRQLTSETNKIYDNIS